MHITKLTVNPLHLSMTFLSSNILVCVCVATLVKDVKGSMLFKDILLQFGDTIICSTFLLEIKKLRFSSHTCLMNGKSLVPGAISFFLISIYWYFFN